MTVLRRTRWLAAVAAVCATGCTASDPPIRACTEIGSPAGIGVTVEKELVARELQLTLRICQDGCHDRRVELQPGSITVGATCSPDDPDHSDDPDGSCSASASPDGTLVGFVDVADLVPGAVDVSGELRTGSVTTPYEEVTVTAAPTYPNGADCPAGGPQTAVRVTAAGLR